MCDKLFFSDKNKNAIKSIIESDIKKEFNNATLTNHQIIITETMNYVIQQAGINPPTGMTEEKYIFLMNKKVYDIVMPVLKKNQKQHQQTIQTQIQTQQPNQKKILNSDPTNLFDPILLKQFENPPVIDYPKPATTKYTQDATENKIKSIENERSTLIPKLKPIDFAIKEDDEKKPNATELYNQLLTSYNNDFNHHDEGSTPISELGKINNKDTKNNYPNIPPIDLLKIVNESDAKQVNFSSVNTESQNIMIDEPKFKQIEKDYYVIFNSKNRDLYKYPNPMLFQVKINPTTNNYIFYNIYDTYNTLIVREKTIVYGGSDNNSVGLILDDIKYVKCDSLTFPSLNVQIAYNESTNTYISTNIFKEPCLYLNISELESPYASIDGLIYNTFAKLSINYYDKAYNSSGTLNSIFTLLNNKNNKEIYNYDPVSNGKLDKLTLRLNNKNGNLYNVGIDKLYIESFSIGDLINSNCGNSYNSTRLTIQNQNNDYISYCSLYNKFGPCNTLNINPVLLEDLIYFYNTIPDFDQIVFLEEYIKITKLKFKKNSTTFEIYAGYTKIINDVEQTININFKDLIPELTLNEYYIIIYNKITNKTYYLKISSITNNSIFVFSLGGMPQFKDYLNLKIGIAKSILSGINSTESNSLFYNQGNYVINVGPNTNNPNLSKWTIDINFPYELLPDYLKIPGLYNPGTIFFIQDKLQVNYTFIISTNGKDYDSVKSYLNGSGND
jgi:hypothetical protein